MSSYRTDADSSVRIQTEGSNKENITVTTNLSASGTFYTLMQGESLLFPLLRGTYDIKVQRQKALQTKKINKRNKKKKSNATGMWHRGNLMLH